MTIRIASVAFVLAVAFAGLARATPVWNGTGWYQVADTIVGPFVWKGPFGSKEDCEATLPENEEDADYTCEYLSEQPNWDE